MVLVLACLSSYTLCYVAFLTVLLIQAHAQPGFFGIDCGADPALIGTKNQRQLRWLRSFPDGKRNCYKINVTGGSKYFIRTVFLYGNYDGRNMLPQFDLLLGPNHWVTVTIFNASKDQFKEIIHVPSMDYVQICQVDTGNGTPFISVIELRTLKNDTYVTQFGSLEFYLRCDLGSNTSYSYPDDVYDRYWYDRSFWNACNFGENWKPLNASIPDDSLNENDYKPGATIMSTAVTPANDSAPLVIRWEPQHETDQFYVHMYFTEIQVLTTNQTRQFNIMINAESWFPNCSPVYHDWLTISSTSAISGKELKFSLERTENSTLPPIISGIEIYNITK